MQRIYLNCCLLLFSMLLLPAGSKGTTTAGTTARNVNTADGIVTLGAAPGTNGPDWETDEEFQGFSGAVNWYVTWDDNNLYLGRIGGNNSEGSVIYLRADYPGATFDNRAFDYDLLNPDVTPMGGVNFAAYLKNGYDEFRTFNGAWSAATTTIAPSFSTQGNGANMEVTIPWSDITGGNGRPTNIRLVLYQVVPAGIACPQEFVYGESPWGTGNVGDGPSVGVNDGVPISARQPGGCDVGDSTATRWWGCYPVIGGVGSNGWAALAPNAGPDDSICQTATAHLLLANTPPGTATGTWSVVSQPLGSPPVTFTDPNNPNAFVQNLQGFGPYVFVWDINYGGCPSLPDTVVITRVPNSSTANTMADTTLTCNGDTLTLRGNDPGNGWSIWTTSDPGITLLNPSDSITQAFGLAPGLNVFTYAITNGVCPVTTAQVNVYVPINVTANAGPDQQLCLASIATLAGNDPDSIQTSANGFWSQVSGPNNGIFTNLSQNSSNFSALIPGQYTLVWSVTNFDCPMATDTMVITNYQSVIADAGGDQVYCFPSDGELLGNNIYSLSSTAVGLWTQLSGPTQAGIQNPDTFFSFVNNLVAGSYAFSWLVSNGVCPPDSDVVRFDVYDIQPNGVIDSLRPDSGQSNGNIIVALPSGGISPYTYSIDGLNFQSNSTFDSLGAGIYEIIVMDNNGCVDSFLIELDSILPTIPPPPRDTLKVPTGFSPNGDGTNDTWEIPGIEAFPNARIDVYNIWGGLVYSSAGVYIPWNGQRGGQDLPAANYYFILDLKAEGQPVLKGSITILR